MECCSAVTAAGQFLFAAVCTLCFRSTSAFSSLYNRRIGRHGGGISRPFSVETRVTMKFRTIALAGVTALALCGPAAASDATGWYLGLGAGWDHLGNFRVKYEPAGPEQL